MQTFYHILPLKAEFIRSRLSQSTIVFASAALIALAIATTVALWHTFYASKPAGLLSSYQLDVGPIIISGLEDNASGLTYSPVSNSLFMVVNNPEKIIELSLDGDVLRTITLTDFEDTEGVAHVEDDKFIILEERRSAVNFVTINSNTHNINKSETSSFALNIFTNSGKNLRLEGVSIDHATGDIYLVKEKSPRALYKISGLLDNAADVNISIPWDIEAVNSNISDLSGLFFEPNSRRLLVLSHESFSLSEFGLDGQYFSIMKLKRSNHALIDSIPQAEGVTLAADGSLYIVSEPNLLYRFKRKAPETTPSDIARHSAPQASLGQS